MCQKGCSYALKGKALVIEHHDHALGSQRVLVRIPPIALATGSPYLERQTAAANDTQRKS